MDPVLTTIAIVGLAAAAALGWHVARAGFRRCWRCGGDGINTGCPGCAR